MNFYWNDIIRFIFRAKIKFSTDNPGCSTPTGSLRMINSEKGALHVTNFNHDWPIGTSIYTEIELQLLPKYFPNENILAYNVSFIC